MILPLWTESNNSTPGPDNTTAPFSFLQPPLSQRYDYVGASMFAAGLLTIYCLVLLLFIISLIRKSRSDLEVVDYLEDFKALRRASMKRKIQNVGIRAPGYKPLASPCGSQTPLIRPSQFYKPAIRPSTLRPMTLVRKPQSDVDGSDSDSDDRDQKHRHFRNIGKIVSYYPGVMRNDVYDRHQPEVIII